MDKMASGNSILPQQRANVEARIKTLVNVDLKEICKAYGYQVSGTKVTLQARCMEILDEIIASNDMNKFDTLRYRINNHGQPPTNRSSSKSYPQASGYAQSHSQSSHGSSKGSGSTQSRLPPGKNYFKYSPFYDVQETLLPLQDLPGKCSENCTCCVTKADANASDPEMPQNRHTVKANLTLRNETAQLIRNDNSLKIMMYCGIAQTMSPHTHTDIAFPSQIEVKINDQDVKANFKGLKNKPGSTKPTDVGAFIRKYNGQQNSIQVTYALTSKRYAFAIYLVRYVSPNQLTETLKNGSVIPKRKVLEEMNRANADPDIIPTSFRMSLKDPISTMRITLPIRSSICKHNQCFDAAFFMQLQDQAPQWSCPVCSKGVSFDSLGIDKYFEDILNNTPKSIEKVDIEPNGQWTVIKEEEEANQSNGVSSRSARAPYDDDFDDDDLVELDTPPAGGQQTNGFDHSSLSFALPPAANVQHAFPVYTPPLSSREPSLPHSAHSNQRRGEKRPAGNFIDLTASDEDEDEDGPPRPAKRQQTTSIPQNHQSSSYGTPASLSDRRYSSNSSHQHSFAPAMNDQQRPSSMHSVMPPGPINSRAYNSQSPLPNPPTAFRPSPYMQPTWPATTRNAFAPQSPTSMMPPAQPSQYYGTLQANDGAFDYGGVPRLPPIQPIGQGVWRHDFGTDYSQSPPE